MQYRKKLVYLVICIILVFSTVAVHAESEVEGLHLRLAAEEVVNRGLGEVTASFARVKSLVGEYEIYARSTITPDLMYAELMLQKNNGGKYEDEWEDYAIINGKPNTKIFLISGNVEVPTSGTYRLKFYVKETNDGSTHSSGVRYTQSISL